MLTPKEIVKELDKYIIGQNDAKRAVAIALRNRWRRMQVESPLREEIIPNNIILIGPTGVGKTEIARRLARLSKAPFVKVEASRFTEVGYVGKDVESMIRDLMEIGINMLKDEYAESNKEIIEKYVEERLLDALYPKPKGLDEENYDKTREFFREQLRSGLLDDKDIEIEHKKNVRPTMKMFTSAGVEEMDFALQDLFNNIMNPADKKKSKMKVKEARKIIKAEEEQKVVNMDKIINDAKDRVEESGIVFIDEIDKIVGSGSQHGPDVSRGGVQRDLLPIVEGTNVMTKYGIIKTHHILFIAAGAFQGVKPTDLIPELQGRFPIRVELKSLDTEDFVQILTKPKNALIKQYTAMLNVDGIDMDFEESGIEKIAYYASKLNSTTENIGARRLQTVLSYILDEIMFEVPGAKRKKVKIDSDYVEGKVGKLVESDDLRKYII